MKAFIVSGFERNSHTFLRSDFAFLASDEWTVVDCEELSFRSASIQERIHYCSLAVVMLVRLHVRALQMLFTRRWPTVLHGLFIAARLDSSKAFSPTEIRCHFLGKTSIAAWAIGVTSGVPFSIVCHGSDLYSSPRAFNLLLRAARRVECVTAFGKGFVFGRLGNDAIGKVVLRRNRLLQRSRNTETPANMRTLDTRDSKFRLIGIGRLVPQKDFAFALRVVEELSRLRQGDIHYDILGDGPLRAEITELAKKLNVSGHVTFHGQMDHEAVLDLLASSDGLLLPCEEKTLDNADGLPVVFQEALSLGVPVFCRQAFGVAELLIDGVNGLSFPVDASPETWARRLSETAGYFDPKIVSATLELIPLEQLS